ncbi:MAG: DUF3107 domain-containing protein [Acidimicrobiales bacterium]
MDVRIGVTNALRELLVEIGDDTDRDAVKEAAEAALSGSSAVFWITDKKGREVGVPAEKLAYVEIGSDDSVPDIGFGSA